MILSALNNYYHRRVEEPDSDIPRLGNSAENISFALCLDETGAVVRLDDLRQAQGKKMVARSMVVPKVGSRTSGVRAFFLWDKTSYLLGADLKLAEDLVARHFAASKIFHHDLLDGVDDPGAKALLAFLDRWNPADAVTLDNWDELAGSNLVFALAGTPGFLHQRPALVDVWSRTCSAADAGVIGQCLVTGETGPVAALHSPIKGVNGAQTAGVALVSFNFAASTSYGLEQAGNAPVGNAVAFAYATALNELLRKGSRQRLSIGDATTVFWAESASPAENYLSLLFEPPLENAKGERVTDAATQGRVRDILNNLRQGIPPQDLLDGLDPDVTFFILGLAAPSGGRISVRFWEQTRLGALLDRVRFHYDALRIEKRYDNEPDFPPLWLLLRQTALAGKAENVSPGLSAALSRALFSGAPFPAALLTAVLERVRAEHGDQDSVTYLRMALVKAYLVRKSPQLKEKLMSLDPDNSEPAYQLGRLFAALERAQQLAVNANATIKDRYFGAASTSPRMVFPVLLRLAQHHLAKNEKSGWLDRIFSEITERLSPPFPAHLTLDEQGLFALGYYHQRNELWRNKKTES